jgi:TRAP-type transport system small permease protein
MMLRIFFRIGDWLNLFARAVSFICLCLMTIIMISEVIWRNLFSSLIWAEEVAATFLGTWFIFIGASVALREGQLICVQVVRSLLPGQIGKVITYAGELMALIFLAVVIIYGFDLTKLAISQPSPALMYPMAYAYLAIPVGSILMFYQILVLMFRGKAISGGGTSIT